MEKINICMLMNIASGLVMNNPFRMEKTINKEGNSEQNNTKVAALVSYDFELGVLRQQSLSHPSILKRTPGSQKLLLQLHHSSTLSIRTISVINMMSLYN